MIEQLCYPLTVTDNFSRYLLAIEGFGRVSGAEVKRTLIKLFSEYGLPLAIRSDNGAPFASHAVAGLSELAVWLIKLGIVPERIRKRHSEENGRHERIKKETASPHQYNQSQQQQRFNVFRTEFNEQRPHEGIDFKRPSWLYMQSTREFPSKIPAVEYGNDFEITRKIRTNGTMKWRGKELFVSETLIGETIGMKPHSETEWLMYFSFLPLAIFDEKTLKVNKL